MIRIVTDTLTGFPLDLMRARGIPVIPQIVIFGETAYRDDTEIDTATFLQKLRAGRETPKTAAPPPHLYLPIFAEAAKNGDTVLVIAPSAKVSGTVRSAETARNDFPHADIRILDTQTLACNQGTLTLLADDLAKQGCSADEIEAHLRAWLPRGHIYFVLDTLEYLRRGGRIGAAKALLGELLQVKPILQIKDGQVAPYDQERTKKRAVARLVEIAAEQVQGRSDSHLCVIHIDAQDEAEALRDELAARTGLTNIPIYLLPPAIVVHAGPKALGIGFFA
ncbi:MAG: DegV family protein [Anaerolineales bacterium]|nr:DegV family protein [Anaerolineales bacterium]MCX7753917.1 DegV family protein [Anaerolineales bacterium]MDW8277996.1 DegV family protein [Anaerolineales bacterium]